MNLTSQALTAANLRAAAFGFAGVRLASWVENGIL
jgi:hypothetical protein